MNGRLAIGGGGIFGGINSPEGDIERPWSNMNSLNIVSRLLEK